jgi:hypothetical protein
MSTNCCRLFSIKTNWAFLRNNIFNSKLPDFSQFKKKWNEITQKSVAHTRQSTDLLSPKTQTFGGFQFERNERICNSVDTGSHVILSLAH